MNWKREKYHISHHIRPDQTLKPHNHHQQNKSYRPTECCRTCGTKCPLMRYKRDHLCRYRFKWEIFVYPSFSATSSSLMAAFSCKNNHSRVYLLIFPAGLRKNGLVAMRKKKLSTRWNYVILDQVHNRMRKWGSDRASERVYI